MNKQSGFTLIELMIVLAIVFILGAIVVGAVSTFGEIERETGINVNGDSNVVASMSSADKLPLNIRCQEGYLFMVDKDGNVSQVKDNNGAGATCYE